MIKQFKCQNIKNIIDSKQVMKVLALNEISGNEKIITKFSFAGGISGYSFGRSQFDIKHNSGARLFLTTKCEFTQNDIERLLALDKNIEDLNEKLAKYRDKIDEYDLIHVQDMIDYVANLEGIPDITLKTFVHLVDYHNQFSLSKNGKFHSWIKTKNTLNEKDVLEFKLQYTKWGKEHPQDVKRRWVNIEENWNEK